MSSRTACATSAFQPRRELTELARRQAQRFPEATGQPRSPTGDDASVPPRPTMRAWASCRGCLWPPGEPHSRGATLVELIVAHGNVDDTDGTRGRDPRAPRVRAGRAAPLQPTPAAACGRGSRSSVTSRRSPRARRPARPQWSAHRRPPVRELRQRLGPAADDFSAAEPLLSPARDRPAAVRGQLREPAGRRAPRVAGPPTPHRPCRPLHFRLLHGSSRSRPAPPAPRRTPCRSSIVIRSRCYATLGPRTPPRMLAEAKQVPGDAM